MNYDIVNGILEMSGFDIGGKILISGADEVSIKNNDTGKYEIAKEVRVIMEIETLKSWIEDYGLLDDIEVVNL